MATLKDHQQAMVDLLASGSGIPASASRLAHAMHDVLGILLLQSAARENSTDIRALFGLDDATTPGLNDKALAADVEACRPKVTRFNVDIKLADMDEVKMTLQNMQSHLDGARDSQRAAERRVKELENTVKQLKDRVAKLKADQAYWYGRCLDAGILEESHEQAGCRKDDTQEPGLSTTKGLLVPPGARFVCTQGKDDTQVCEHSWVEETEYGTPTGVSICTQCGAAKL